MSGVPWMQAEVVWWQLSVFFTCFLCVSHISLHARVMRIQYQRKTNLYIYYFFRIVGVAEQSPCSAPFTFELSATSCIFMLVHLIR